MQDLIKHEQFEIEVLEKLNSARLLQELVFAGGTMLRLCHGLNRYSVDLDFWLVKEIDEKSFFGKIKQVLAEDYLLKDAAIKYHTLLFEFKSKSYPRSLKIEIRRGEKKSIKTEESIAYSPHSNIQVMLRTVSLATMMEEKIETFLSRKEIRDVFDMEFILKKGLPLAASKEKLAMVHKQIGQLKEKDYASKLGSLLPADQRGYYSKENFKILKAAIESQI